MDGANAARDFLKGHGIAPDKLQLVWDTIALHTTIGIAEHKENEVALMYSGVGLDVMGEGYEHLSADHREGVSPDNFKQESYLPFLVDLSIKPKQRSEISKRMYVRT